MRTVPTAAAVVPGLRQEDRTMDELTSAQKLKNLLILNVMFVLPPLVTGQLWNWLYGRE